MKVAGVIILVIGVLIALGSLFMSTSVPTEIAAATMYGLPHTSEVYNLGKLQSQSLTFLTGCTVAIIGMMAAMAGVVLEAIARDKPSLLTDAALEVPRITLPTVVPLTETEIEEQAAEDKMAEAVITAKADRFFLIIFGCLIAAILLAAYFVLGPGKA